MEMTKKQVLIAMAFAVFGCLLFVWLFATPVNGKVYSITVNEISDTAYQNTLIPYYLDTFSKDYIEERDHFIKDFDETTPASAYREIYIEVKMTKYTPVPFQTVWVGIDEIPEKYRDTVVCVTNAPVMCDVERENSLGNLTFIVKSDGFTDEQLKQMAEEISLKIKWTLAMGIDGYVYP